MFSIATILLLSVISVSGWLDEELTAMDVNLTVFQSDGEKLKGNGLWLFCIADKPLRDVDWYQNGVRLDDFNEKRLSNFECPENITGNVGEVCEISAYSYGYQLYVPEKYTSFNDTWKCLAEPIEGYPRSSDPKPFKLNVCESVDLVLILDGSGSVGTVNFGSLLLFTKEFLWHADINSGRWKVAIILYSTDAIVKFYLSNYTSTTDVLNAVNNIAYTGGWTNTADALKLMHEDIFSVENGDRLSVPNTAILLTDGLSNKNKDQTIPEANNAKAKGITIYTVSIQLSNHTEVEAIATAPYSKHGLVVETFDEIKSCALKLFRVIFTDVLCPDSIPVFTTTPEPTPIQTTTLSMRTENTSNAQDSTTNEPACKCSTSVPETEISQEDLNRRIAERKERIKIDKANTAVEIRKRTSARDDRMSSTAIGYASIAILSFIFLGILTIDFIDICRNRRNIK